MIIHFLCHFTPASLPLSLCLNLSVLSILPPVFLSHPLKREGEKEEGQFFFFSLFSTSFPFWLLFLFSSILPFFFYLFNLYFFPPRSPKLDSRQSAFAWKGRKPVLPKPCNILCVLYHARVHSRQLYVIQTVSTFIFKEGWEIKKGEQYFFRHLTRKKHMSLFRGMHIPKALLLWV